MLRIRDRLATAFVVIASLCAHAHARTIYTTEASFVSAIESGNYLEDFNNFTFGHPLDGSQLTWTAPGANGWDWTASAPNGLWSNTGALTTAAANDPLTIASTFEGADSFGALFSNTNLVGNSIPGIIHLTTDIGDAYDLVIPSGTSAFLGFIGDFATTFTVTATSAATDNYVQIDHIRIGLSPEGIPEPASLGGLGLGFVIVTMRRNRV